MIAHARRYSGRHVIQGEVGLAGRECLLVSIEMKLYERAQIILSNARTLASRLLVNCALTHFARQSWLCVAYIKVQFISPLTGTFHNFLNVLELQPGWLHKVKVIRSASLGLGQKYSEAV